MMERAARGRNASGAPDPRDGRSGPDLDYKRLVESMMDGLWAVDSEYVTTYANPYLCRLLGYRADDLVGRSMFDFIDATDPGINERFREPRRDDEGDPIALKLISKDGRTRWVELSSSPLIAPDGRGSGTLIEVKDISGKKRSEDAYRLLVDNSVQGFGIFQRGRLVFCNDALAAIAGHRRERLLRMSPKEILSVIHPDDRYLAFSEQKAIFEGRAKLPDQRLRLIDSAGVAHWVESVSVRTDFQGGLAMLVTCMRIERRQEAERALRESEHRFRAFVENAPVAIGVLREGKTMYVNSAYLRLFGVSNIDDIIDRPIAELVSPLEGPHVAGLFFNGTPGEPGGKEFEMVAKRLDGDDFACRVVLTVLDLSDGPATLAFFFDLTRQKDSEKSLEDSRVELRNLANHLLHAREEERKTVAREIHDELGQVLTAIKMDVQWIERKLGPRTEQIGEKIRGVVDLADQTIQIVHRIATELRPGVLDDLGLAVAIEWLGGDFSRRNGIPCRVDVASLDPSVSGKGDTALFRIIQEALINVSRHARASRASVEVWEEDGRLKIRVQDDGVGITEAQAGSSASIGLIGIRERVQDLRGEMSIVGRPGAGTVLSVAIPLTREGAIP